MSADRTELPKNAPPADGRHDGDRGDDGRDNQGRYEAELPAPDVHKSRWPFPLVWVVPIVAAIAAGWYLWRIYNDHGVEIAITFNDVSNLRVKDTPLNYHGVRVGSVSRMDLNEDRTKAVVYVRLHRAFQESIARDGGKFWLVRPDTNGGIISGLSTVITGPFIDCVPGKGDPVYRFEGLTGRPVVVGDGRKIILHTDRLSHLERHSPVFFRGLQVGSVQDIRLNADSTGVNVTIFIWDRFAKLVRRGSRFWSVTGADIKGDVFSGIDLDINNTRALFAGGVAFATPDDGDDRSVPDGTGFTLHDAGNTEWLKWSARIDLPDDPNSMSAGEGPRPGLTVP